VDDDICDAPSPVMRGEYCNLPKGHGGTHCSRGGHVFSRVCSECAGTRWVGQKPCRACAVRKVDTGRG
jgi:hypothetical protein